MPDKDADATECPVTPAELRKHLEHYCLGFCRICKDNQQTMATWLENRQAPRVVVTREQLAELYYGPLVSKAAKLHVEFQNMVQFEAKLREIIPGLTISDESKP